MSLLRPGVTALGALLPLFYEVPSMRREHRPSPLTSLDLGAQGRWAPLPVLVHVRLLHLHRILTPTTGAGRLADLSI